jgi:mRNA-degrading endonuclease YafQ of YafQ-DinJ toxin-antitoxin module
LAAGYAYTTLNFTDTFLETLADSRRFNRTERSLFLKALRLLDSDEHHRSLRVHQLTGGLAGVWSASASDSLRMTFIRETGGRKTMLTCTHHYGSSSTT